MQNHAIEKELRHIGDFLAKIAEKSEHVYWLSSPNLDRIVFVSPAYEKIWGRPREELYNNPQLWDQFLHPDDRRDRHPINELAERVHIEGSGARFEENYRIVRPDGEIRWIIDRGFPVFTDEGEICGVTGVAIDVTKERQAEEYLRVAKETAEAANQAKTKFLSNVSHELRTPLNGILGMTEILQYRQLSKDDKEIVSDIHDLANHLLFLVNDILSFASIETGKLTLNINPTDIHTLITNITEQMTYRLVNKPLTLEVFFEENVPPTIYLDQARFRQILINLVDNALKFTEKGTIKITVAAHKTISEHCNLKISVSDTGVGIKPESQAKIFERFTQAHESCYIRSQGGVGLGLSICDELVKLMQGQIGLISKVNEGSTFTFSIPTKYSDSPVEEQQKIEEIVPNTSRRIHLLLVEDEPINQKVMQFMLTNIDCTFDIAGTGGMALSLAKSKHFDLILMDIQLPDIDGVAVTKELRQLGISTPIVATTAHAFIEEKRSFLAAGMNDVLAKPFRQEQIAQVIKRWVKAPVES